jgi:XTP/dITP diphosphohydrolase
MVRADHRAVDKIRKVKITRDYNKYAEGSCLMELGGTRVICTASVENRVPPWLKDTGTGWVTAEYGMIPRSCKTRIFRDEQRGKTPGRTYEIQRLIGRSLRSVIDTAGLGERTIYLDCDVLQADGGTRTASITGSFIALADAVRKLNKDSLVKAPVIKDYVAATSVGIYKGTAVLDLTYEEDVAAEVDMNIVMTAKGRFIEIQGTAEKNPFSKNQLEELLDLAKKGIRELTAIQRKELPDLALADEPRPF